MVVAAVMVSASPVAAVELPYDRVLRMDGNQWEPFGNATYVTFHSNSNAQPKHWNAWAMERTTEDLTKLNAPGTFGYAGNLEPATNTAIFQQTDGQASDIFTYDLDTDTRTEVPDINTARWEWGPRISSTHVMFVRNERIRGNWKFVVRVRDRVSGVEQVLGRYSVAVGLSPGNVGTGFATWSVCRKTCEVMVRDLATRETTTLAAPHDRPQYGPTLDEDANALYFIRSGFGCGFTVGVWEVPLDDLSVKAVKLASFPSGTDADYLAVAPNPDTLENDLLFSYFRCRPSADVDVWAVRGVSGP
jgi:hypothetical protein